MLMTGVGVDYKTCEPSRTKRSGRMLLPLDTFPMLFPSFSFAVANAKTDRVEFCRPVSFPSPISTYQVLNLKCTNKTFN